MSGRGKGQEKNDMQIIQKSKLRYLNDRLQLRLRRMAFILWQLFGV